MKASLSILCILGMYSMSYAQTNTFPPSGNVGIGTTSPQFKLTIDGDLFAKSGFSTYAQDGLFGSTAKPIRFGTPHQTGVLMGYDDDGGGSYSPRIGFQQNNSSNSPFAVSSKSSIGLLTNGDLTINNGASNTEKLRITETGNVGIGTIDTKGYKLAVNGAIIAESVKVKLYGSWPDYVFHKTYSLQPLQEVEKFIQVNQHLPGIPSALEVEKEGIDIGEMNAKLLKKIEELTLYLIEINKKLTDQNEKIIEQQKENNRLGSKR